MWDLLLYAALAAAMVYGAEYVAKWIGLMRESQQSDVDPDSPYLKAFHERRARARQWQTYTAAHPLDRQRTAAAECDHEEA